MHLLQFAIHPGTVSMKSDLKLYTNEFGSVDDTLDCAFL